MECRSLIRIVFKPLRGRQKEWEVSGRAQIGRKSDSDLCLPNIRVSQKHAVLEEKNGRYIIEDQASTTGTFVHGQRISAHELALGDEVIIGPYILSIESTSPFKILVSEMPKLTDHPENTLFRIRQPLRVSPFVWLGLVFSLLVLGGIFWRWGTGIFLNRPVSPGHARFERNCTQCHTPWSPRSSARPCRTGC